MLSSENPLKASSVILALTAIIAGSLSVTAQTPAPTPKTEPITGSITGRVVNENGQGLPNVMVGTRAPVASSQRTTSTDSEGSFKFEGLDSALYTFFAFAPGHAMPPRDPEADPNYYRLNDSVTLTLIKGGVITGTVLSPSGEPEVQVAVRANLVRDANGQAPKYSAFPITQATDDRGVYRLYGLIPGTYVVSAGGRNSFGGNGVYDEDAPTYAPSSTRDTAAQISVSSGEETSVDIKYRGETGHAISGTLTGMSEAGLGSAINVSLTQFDNGAPMTIGVSFSPPGSKTFAIYGVADGEYDLTAQLFANAGDTGISENRHITVKGADITGIELNLKPLGSISGHVTLAKSELAECKGKRQPLFSEMLVAVRRSEKRKPPEPQRNLNFFRLQGVPNQAGDFQMKNLSPGQYNIGARFFAKYWYLKSIVQRADTTGTAPKPGAGTSQNDLARNGVALKFGESISRVTIKLAEGAASLRGSIKLETTGQSMPPKLLMYLVPAEKESAEDVLRFFASEVGSDGTSALNNLPPGRYWAVAQVIPNNEIQSEFKLRSPAAAEARAQLRRAAESGKFLVELKPCQNMADYQLPVLLAPQKN